VLLIACINFMTLAIGHSARRAREVGIRKVVGARRRQLAAQFWGEALVLSGVALVLGLVLAAGFLPVFNDLTGKTLRLGAAADGAAGALLVGLVLFTGLVAGSYPALVLSGFRPIETLTNRFRLSGSNVFTKALVVLQFALSVFLITSTVVMKRQLDYTRAKELGFDKEHVVVIPTGGLDGSVVAPRFRAALEREPHVVGVTATGYELGRTGSMGYGFEHEGRHYVVNVLRVETNYLDFLGLDLVAGRNFDPKLATDSTQAIIVNEALVRAFALDDPLGKPIPSLPGDPQKAPLIVGVVEDHHFQALYQEVAPMMLTLDPEWASSYLLVRIRPDDMPRTLDLLKTTWQAVAPDLPFAYRFLDDTMQERYRDDERWSQIVRYAALFAVLIAALGLLGLAALTVTRRTKEIGIRKVLGARLSHIVLLIAREFALLVGAGVVLAAPVAYLVMRRWLEDFAYRIPLSGWLFVLAGLAALTVALGMVGYQAVRAAGADPVKSLRYE
jgi:putative ABC transport system permease protein